MIDATHFPGLDSLDFVSREKPYPIDWFNLDPMSYNNGWHNESKVEFIRGCLFFAVGQELDKDGKKINLAKLRDFFTDKAIILLEKDGYIKIKDK